MLQINFSIRLKIYYQIFKKFLCRDSWRKACALLLAVFCWGIIFQQVTPANRQWDVVNNIPVTLRESADIYVPKQILPTVRIKIAINYSYKDRHFTPKEFLLQVDPKKIPLNISDGKMPISNYTVTLTEDHILKKPDGISILKFDPPTVSFQLDPIIQAQKDVSVPVQGEVRDGYAYSLHPIPSQVTLHGPSFLVHQLESIKTKPIFLFPANSHDFMASVKVLTSDNPALKVFPDKIKVQVKLENTKKFTTQKYDNIPLRVLFSQISPLTLKTTLPQSIQLILQGRKDILKQLSTQLPQAYVDLSSYIIPGNYKVKIQLTELPNGISVQYISPIELNIALIKKTTESLKNTPK